MMIDRSGFEPMVRAAIWSGVTISILVLVPSFVIGQGIDDAMLRRMVAEKDYPTLTDSKEDQQIALQLLKLLGGHRDRIGNVYLSRTFSDADMPVILAFQDARSIIWADSQVGDEGMTYLAKLKSLTSVGKLPMGVTDKGVAHLRGLPLRGLHLPPSATDKCMKTVGSLSELYGLALSQNITDEGFIHIRELKQLGGLVLNDSQVTDAAFANIGENPRLGLINFGNAPNITPEVVRHLRQLSQLHWLTGPPGTNDRTLELLADVKTLTRLELSSYEGVTDEGMKYLPAHEWMHDLALGPNITDAGMEHVGKLKHFGNLDLTKTQVTGKGLAFLGPLGPSKLELSDSVSDEGLASISKFTRLAYLILNGNFTDACLPHLPKRLDEVLFNDTRVTLAGLNTLRRERPGLRIHIKSERRGSEPFDQRTVDLSRQPAK